MPRAIYADHNATTPVGLDAQARIRRAFETWGNPSSAHKIGREARALLEDSRALVATAVGVAPQDIVFTSGGSEANTMAILGARFLQGTGFRLLTSRVEHSSIKDTLKFLQDQGTAVETARILPTGELDLDDFTDRLDRFQPHLVSLMAANNETGVLFPLAEVAKLCAERSVLFHTDAVQAFGKVPPTFWEGADFVSLSAHKVYGPKGVGALVVKPGRKLVPTHYGGSQEIKRRGGTENLIGIAGFGGACEKPADNEDFSRMASLRERFEAKLASALDGIAINGAGAPRLPNTSNVRFAGIPAQVLLGALDIDGVYVSAGSACSSGSITPSHVLLEMGLSEEAARECVRVSWGRTTTPDDVDTAADLVIGHVNRIRARRK